MAEQTPFPALAPTPFRPLTASTLCAAVAALTLVGCSAPTQGDPQEADASASPSATSSASPSASPSPVAPADGTDLAACSDGECEVEATAPAEFEFDEEFGIDTLTIDPITDGTVALTMTSTAGTVSFGCFDDGAVVCDSSMQGTFGAGGSTTGEATGGPGARVTLNDLVLEVVEVTDDSALVRIAPE